MKKILTISVVIILVIILTGCGKPKYGEYAPVEPGQVTPSLLIPITLSKESAVLRNTETQIIKVAVYNASEDNKPFIKECSEGLNVQLNYKDSEKRENYVLYSMEIQILDGEINKYICTISYPPHTIDFLIRLI